MAADFRRHYGIQLFQTVGTDALPWAEFAALAKHLPPDSALARSELGDRARWGIGEQLLARMVHLQQLAVYQHLDPKKRGKAPKPMRTPWDYPHIKRPTERLLELNAREARRMREVASGN